MKVKEIDRIASVAWSPKELDTIYLAAGTVAGQLDSSFSTKAVLELYEWNLNEPGLDIPVKASYTSENRFHKVVWGSNGIGGDSGKLSSGVIVGGCDGGVMQVFSAAKLLKNEDPVILTKSKHVGPVKALDFNQFRPNLVASGATESEIFIWDLNNPKTPMSPGAKIQPADDVTDLEWNKQVEHILATTFPTRCVVWDLRKNEPVIKVSDTTSRIKYKCVKWHPEVATQMCLASEDDSNPVVQLWDLRYATSPLKVISGHQRGILGMSWCAQDSDILVSCGKDSRIICFNPNCAYAGYEMVYEIPTSSQFSFDIAFCPKNPLVVSSCSFDGRVSIYGLSGGAQIPVTTSKLADSFPGMDMSMSHAPVPAQPTVPQQLRDPPKWMKRPAGASFSFGGRLIAFQNVKTPATQPGQQDKISGIVTISQVVTLPSLIERSKKLEEALEAGRLELYCSEKAKLAGDSNEARVWEFLQASFSQNPREAFATLLGYSPAEISAKLQKLVPSSDINDVTNSFGTLGYPDDGGDVNKIGTNYQNGFIENKSGYVSEFDVPTDDSLDGKINQAIISGNIDIAVHLCLENERWTDALLLATKGSPELMVKAQTKYFEKSKGPSANTIRAVVRNDLSYLVSNCKLESWKQVLATSLTYADDAEFSSAAEKLGNRLLSSQKVDFVHGALLCYICSSSLNQLVDAWLGNSEEDSASPDKLQDVVEQVMVLKKAADLWGRESKIGGGSLAGKMREYANLLVSQGCINAALTYLKDLNDPTSQTLKERLQLSLGYTPTATRQPRLSLTSRSRQSSESSSGIRTAPQRPSHPVGLVSRSSQENMYDTSGFRNLTGPLLPPTAPAQVSAYNSNPIPTPGVYNPVPPSGPPAPPPGVYNPNPVTGPPATGVYNPSGYSSGAGQYSPSLPPPPPPSGLVTYAKPAETNPVAAPLPTMYNPIEAAKDMLPPQPHEPLQRKASGGSLPRPFVSNVASGWNDPPPIMMKSKTAQSQLPAKTMITHPIFGQNPEAASHQMPGMPNPGMTGMSNPGMTGMPNPGMTGMPNPGMTGMPGAPPPMQMQGQLQNPSGAAYGGPASMPPPPPTAASHPYQHASAAPPPPMVGQGFGQGQGMSQAQTQWW